jgi:dipeptidyl aminopeptidase/acylaminoacyl peptidase
MRLYFTVLLSFFLIGSALADEGLELEAVVFVTAPLERLNKKVEFRLYSEEDHVLIKPENVVDFWERRLEFLRENLGAAR